MLVIDPQGHVVTDQETQSGVEYHNIIKVKEHNDPAAIE